MQKIKAYIGSEQGKDVLVVLIVILVGLGSFELGRLSMGTNSSSGIKIEYPELSTSQAANAEIAATSQKTSAPQPKPKVAVEIYFASKRGHKYYPAGCAAGKTIKMENRVYFDTRAQAEAAGYELSSSCR
jgi:hypothetical protein